MFRTAFVFFLACVAGVSTAVNSPRLNPADEMDRKEIWKQVKADRRGKLPKSAIEKLKSIHEGAVADEAWPEAILALCVQFEIEGETNRPAQPWIIRKLQQAIPDAPKPMQPVMKVLLARHFFTYYQNNQWRFQQRSQTAQSPGEDFETWDLTRILNEIDQNFTQALADADALKATPVADFDMLLQAGNISDANRPTMFDFLAFQAMQFYTLDEQFVRQQQAFEIKSESPIFASRDAFLEWNPKTEDEDSFTLRAVRLLQDLIKFHADDEDPTALLDADLYRFRFGHSVATGSDEEVAARYRSALERFIENHVDHSHASLACAMLTANYQADDPVKAVEIASKGVALFKDSRGGKQCQNLIQQIKSPQFKLTTEKVWNGDVSINVNYRNMDKLWFRLVPFDFEAWKKWGNRRSPQNLHGKELTELMGQAPVVEWTSDLPETKDFKDRVEKLTPKFDVPSGCYVVIACNNPEFKRVKNDPSTLDMAEVWVSDLAMVVRNGIGETNWEIQAFQADSGEPAAGATVDVEDWTFDGRNSYGTNRRKLKTDANGIVSIKFSKNGNSRVVITQGDQKLGRIAHTWGTSSANRNSSSTIFFTDRSIYRPGQAIQFKGVCVSADQRSNEYKTIPNRDVNVQLIDANGQQVEKRKFRTNEFGSFSGSFTAPRDRLTGQMTLIAKGIRGHTSIRVEEYKRPKFITEIEKPTAAFQLGKNVTMTGSATSYTGAPIDNSAVTWRVVRSVRYSPWCYCRYWYFPFNQEQKEIANGTTTTDTEGNFSVEFPAEPDASIDRKFQPAFQYTVYADVTDSAGETRSASQSTIIGYTSLEAAISIEQWQTTDEAVKVDVKVSTLDGEGQATKGTLKIHRLKSPDKVQRAPFKTYWPNDIARDPANMGSWEMGEVVFEEEVSSDEEGKADVAANLKAGAYRVVFETTDPAGNKVPGEANFMVHDLAADKFNIKTPSFFGIKSASVEPGEELEAFFATGYDSGRAWVEIEHRGKVIESFWTEASATQQKITFPITETYRGGIQLRVTFVRENRTYLYSRRIDVPWSNKELSIKWEHFVSNLTPGGKETWTAVVKGPDANQVVAEMVAGMYDASLDAFSPHRWQKTFGLFYQDYQRVNLQSFNSLQHFRREHRHQPSGPSYATRYRHFNPQLSPRWRVTQFQTGQRGRKRQRYSGIRTKSEITDRNELARDNAAAFDAPLASETVPESEESFSDSSRGNPNGLAIDLDDVSPRKNLQETAFFYPHLEVAEDGTVRIEFEIPEALTRWKIFGFAHDNELRTAYLSEEMTTSKDLMVQPNPPRFLREGDMLEFSVKVTNQSDDPQTGTCRLTFADANTEESVDAKFGNQELDQPFELPPRQSKSLFWKLKVPDFVGALTYKAIGGTESVSDGEEGFLPVLSKRILVKESLPLPIRGNQTKTFDFAALQKAVDSETLQSQSLTVQMTSNPTWYAVLSLPYLMEYPHQCSEQTFNRIYANAIGQHVVNSNPRIAKVFEQWRGTAALDSPLEKNEDLRNVLLAESPWLDDAKDESQSRRDVGILFDKNRMESEIRRATQKLAQMQHSDGSWPWFAGGPSNDYITLYIATGFGRLDKMGVKVDMQAALRSVDRLDWWLNQQYQRHKRNGQLGQNHLSHTVCLYLYGRSFFLKKKPVAKQYKAAFDYFVGQGKKHWTSLSNRQSQGHVALGLKRIGDQDTPMKIMKSLTERSLQEDELGMFWREGESSWWWYRAPIETQALMIEAYDEVARDSEKVEELKIWLLKQKQTQNWKTTKATADACYGLLLRGTDRLASNKLVSVKLGDIEIKPGATEAGTGFYQQKFVRGEIKPEMAKIEMSKSDEGIAWGSVHWEYLEDVGNIKPYEGTPLTLKKGLFLKKNTPQGPVIKPVDGPVSVGDELVMRVEVRVDRAMEFVHLKDYRGSGTEPVNVLSRYKYQDGLTYYESTKDTASHFFIDYLPRGTYVFEYSVRVQHRGEYETGIAELQCMYAPEFNSHSASVKVVVQ